MLYIHKNRTPQNIKISRKKIINTPDSGYNEIIVPRDTKKLRKLFDLMPKMEIREALFKEQHGLCAYCMRSIVPEKKLDCDEEMRIEHYIPLSMDKELALDYKNFLGVCHGGNKDEKDEGEALITCCDAHRGDTILTINPGDARQMEAIAYRRSGYILVKDNLGLDKELVQAMQKDINDVLHLNGELDENGDMVYDTTSRIVAGRKSVYDSASNQLERWDKKGILTPEYLQEMIDKLTKQLEGDSIADPFVGVRIYCMKKRLKRLKKQFR